MVEETDDHLLPGQNTGVRDGEKEGAGSSRPNGLSTRSAPARPRHGWLESSLPGKMVVKGTTQLSRNLSRTALVKIPITVENGKRIRALKRGILSGFWRIGGVKTLNSVRYV